MTTRQHGGGGQLLSEAYAGGPLDGLTVTNTYDEYLRRTNVAVLGAQGAVLASTAYTYGWASRLQTVSDGTNTATYSYLANSMLVAQIEFAHGGATTMTTTRQYDRLYRLTNIATVDPQSTSLSSFAYVYNSANQRTRRTDTGGDFWVYDYDKLGQVISGKRYWQDGTPVAGQQFEYAFDDIGNRKTAASGGDQWGGHLRYQHYTANALNQYESRIVPGYVDVVGTAHSNATVTVNEQTAYRKGEYFRAELPVNNATGAVWLSITNLAVLNTTTNDLLTNILGHALVPATPETFAYDADGNLAQYGKWNYTWDAENRLVAMTNIPSVPQSTRKALAFRYDWLGRRIEKTVYTNNGSAYFPNYTNRFIYDGWNLLAELNTPNSALRTYMWGLDLSGTLQGAGGVGGLLSVTVHTGPNAGTYFPCFDGNGNVVAFVNAATGEVAARYEYGPFGELLRATGPIAKVSPLRFSTKYQDDETDLLYYGYRYYDASTGRWLSRDPLEEAGGLDLYALLDNEPLDRSDALGMNGQVPRPLWTQASASAVLRATARSWRSQGWDFAAGLLEFFYENKSPGPDFVLEGSAGDAWRIKSNSRYRAVMSSAFEKYAHSSCHCSIGGFATTGTVSGHVDIYFFQGELFYALGGGHFDYTGTISISCSAGIASSWRWRGSVVQRDKYVFLEDSWGQFFAPYSAAYYLQSVWRYHWFFDRQEWSDSFGTDD